MKHIVDTTEVESGWMVLKGHDPNRRMVKATLIIGDERVFTESEVKNYIIDLRRAQHEPAEFTERIREMHPKGGHYTYVELVSDWVARAEAMVRKEYGISDPA